MDILGPKEMSMKTTAKKNTYHAIASYTCWFYLMHSFLKSKTIHDGTAATIYSSSQKLCLYTL